jgi:hypothetical protein
MRTDRNTGMCMAPMSAVDAASSPPAPFVHFHHGMTTSVDLLREYLRASERNGLAVDCRSPKASAERLHDGAATPG